MIDVQIWIFGNWTWHTGLIQGLLFQYWNYIVTRVTDEISRWSTALRTKLSKNYFIVHHKQFMLSARHFLDKYFHFGNKCYYVKIWFKSARRVKQTCLAFRAAFFHCCKYISSASKTLSANCVLICYSSINVARIHVFHYYINLEITLGFNEGLALLWRMNQWLTSSVAASLSMSNITRETLTAANSI